MLSRLEHESMGLKAHLLRQDVQSGLNRKREALEVLMDRMRDLSRVCAAESGWCDRLLTGLGGG